MSYVIRRGAAQAVVVVVVAAPALLLVRVHVGLRVVVGSDRALFVQPPQVLGLDFHSQLQLMKMVRLCLEALALGHVVPLAVCRVQLKWGAVVVEANVRETVVLVPSKEHSSGGVGLKNGLVNEVEVRSEARHQGLHIDQVTHVAVFIVYLQRLRGAEPNNLTNKKNHYDF